MANMDHLRNIAKEFGVTFEGVEEPRHAILPTVFLLDRAHVLRVRLLTHLEEFRRWASLLEQVHERIPFTVSLPMRAKTGHPYVIDGERFWYLSPYLPGKILAPWQSIHEASDDDTERVLEALRKLHDSTVGMTAHEHEEPTRFSLDIREKLAATKHLLSPHAERRLALALERIAAHERMLHPEDLCFVHGDFHHGNVLVDDRGAIRGLIDFDFCRIGHPFEDLGFTMMMCLGRYESDAFRFDELLFQKILQWYGLPPKEHSLLAEYLLAALLIDLASFADADEYGAMENREWYLRFQISMTQDLCARFSDDGPKTALPGGTVDMPHFPVELPPHILDIAANLGVRKGDITERFVRGSGKGGQKINKTSSCVELHHAPTGVSVRVQQHREQSKNRIAAWKLLIEKIEEKMKGEESLRSKARFKIRKQKQRRSQRAKEKVLREKKLRGEIKEKRRKLS